MNNSKKDSLKVPVPISLSRKRSLVEDPTLKLSALQNVDSNCKITSARMISNMKEELSHIKMNVQKLIVEEDAVENNHNKSANKAVVESLREEVNYQKKVEERLRKQLKEIKNKVNADCMEEFLQQKQKMAIENRSLHQKISKLQSELKIARDGSRVEQLTKQLSKYQADRKNIVAQYSKLKQHLKLKLDQIRLLKSSNDSLTIRIQNYEKDKGSKKVEDLLNQIKLLEANEKSKEQMLNRLQKNIEDYRKQLQIAQRKQKQLRVESEMYKSKIRQILTKTNQSAQQALRNQTMYTEQINRLKKKLVQKNNEVSHSQHQILKQEIENKKKIQKQLCDQVQHLKEMQEKIVDEYELKLLKLENDIEQQKQKISTQSLPVANNDNCFDVSLKQLMLENQQFKAQIKIKNQEIYAIKGTFEDNQRKIEELRRQVDMQRLKFQNEDKNKRNAYEINLENIANQIEIYKMKNDNLQKRLDLKCAQIKKKDDFIQTVIVTKATKKEDQPDLAYVRRQLQVFLAQ